MLSMMANNLVGILFSITSFKVSNQERITEPVFLISLFSLLLSFGLMPVPKHTTHHKEGGSCQNKMIKHQVHLVAYIGGPEPPEEDQPPQALLVHNLCLGGPLPSSLLSRYIPQAPVGLDNCHISAINVDRG